MPHVSASSVTGFPSATHTDCSKSHDNHSLPPVPDKTCQWSGVGHAECKQTRGLVGILSPCGPHLPRLLPSCCPAFPDLFYVGFAHDLVQSPVATATSCTLLRCLSCPWFRLAFCFRVRIFPAPFALLCVSCLSCLARLPWIVVLFRL